MQWVSTVWVCSFLVMGSFPHYGMQWFVSGFDSFFPKLRAFWKHLSGFEEMWNGTPPATWNLISFFKVCSACSALGFCSVVCFLSVFVAVESFFCASFFRVSSFALIWLPILPSGESDHHSDGFRKVLDMGLYRPCGKHRFSIPECFFGSVLARAHSVFCVYCC